MSKELVQWVEKVHQIDEDSKDFDNYHYQDVIDTDLPNLYKTNKDICVGLINELSVKRLNQLKKSLELSISCGRYDRDLSLRLMKYIKYQIAVRGSAVTMEDYRYDKARAQEIQSDQELHKAILAVVNKTNLPENVRSSLAYYISVTVGQQGYETRRDLVNPMNIMRIGDLVRLTRGRAISSCVDIILLECKANNISQEMELAQYEARSEQVKNYNFMRLVDIYKTIQDRIRRIEARIYRN